MNDIVLKPNYRELIAEMVLPVIGASVFVLLIQWICEVIVYRYLPPEQVMTYTLGAVSLFVMICLLYTYIKIVTISWTITDEQLCRKKGILSFNTDYIELYRIVDYAESQTLLQKIFRVKSVLIISTDKSDQYFVMYGIPQDMDVVKIIRSRVEHCKQMKRIYEITNN